MSDAINIERWPARILHIREELANIVEFTKDMDLATFKSRKMAVYAVSRSFQIIGEATKKVPESVRAQYDDIPWRKMTGFRDRIVHDYDGVDTEMMWNIIKDEFPTLIPAISRITLPENNN